MIKKLVPSALLAGLCFPALPWGQKGHDTVAYIAQENLTPVAYSAIDSILDGYSIVYWANWLDNASHTPEYEYTKTWHYKNIDADQDYESAPDIPEGNIIEAIKSQTEILANPESSKREKALALKMVVHFLGDIHQPMHMGRATDRGGNSHYVMFFKRPTNLHSVWDTDLLEASHAWSHTEWKREIDRLTKEEKEKILKNGNPAKWGEETYEVCRDVYEKTPQDTNIEYTYIADWTPVVEEQLEKGGLRLADVLNTIFDPSYTPYNNFIGTK